MTARKPVQQSIDLVKAAVVPLALGFLTSAMYYAHFRVPALSLLSPQCIVTGLYVCVFYGLAPWWALRALSRLVAGKAAYTATAILLAVGNVALLLATGQSAEYVIAGALVAVILQLLFVASTTATRSGVVASEESSHPAVTVLSLAIVVLACVHFALFVFPFIPYYYAGGRPIPVYAIPSGEAKDVLADNFINRKDRPSLNPTLPTYKMTLLYESSDDYFFLAERRGEVSVGQSHSGNVGFGTIVTRVRRSAIARIDYLTPATLNLKELLK